MYLSEASVTGCISLCNFVTINAGYFDKFASWLISWLLKHQRFAQVNWADSCLDKR